MNEDQSPDPATGTSLRLRIRTGRLAREAQDASAAAQQSREPDELLAPAPAWAEDDPPGTFDCLDLSSQLQ